MSLNEAYNIPHNGYVVINSDNQYISKEFKTAKTGKELWTDDIRQAALWKPELESEAYKVRQWCFNVYEKDEFYVKYVESNDELDKQQILKYIPDLIKAYEQFVLAGIDFQKLAKQSDFEKYKYTLEDYENKKTVHPVLINILSNPDNVVKSLGTWMREVIKASELEETNKDLLSRGEKFVSSWNAIIELWKKIPKNYIPIIIEHLSNLDRNKNESYSSLAKEFEMYENMWN
jgi:hypothetical protein